MKNILILAILLIAARGSFAESRSGKISNEPPRRERPNRDPGLNRVDLGQVILEMANQIVRGVSETSQTRREDLNAYLLELSDCPKLLPRFQMDCFQKYGIGLVQLALSPDPNSGVIATCTNSSSTNEYLWDGIQDTVNAPNGRPCEIKVGERYQLLSNETFRKRALTHQTDFKQVRPLEGLCAGAEGYIFESRWEKHSCR